jgi:hypothetical protein
VSFVVGREVNMLSEVGVIQEREEKFGVSVRRVINVDIEITGDEKFMWGCGSSGYEGMEVSEEVRKGDEFSWYVTCSGISGRFGQIMISVNIEDG